MESIQEVITVQNSAPSTKVYSTSREVNYQRLVKKYFPVLGQLEDTQTFRTLKSDLLTSAQIMILKYALSEAKLKKASFITLCQGLKILNDMERLDSGKSTINIAHAFSVMPIEELQND